MQDKVVVITGASAGIGAALAELLAARGASVVLVARREAPLAEVAGRCGERAHAIVADVTRREEVRRVVEESIARFGRIDVLVNNGRYVGPGHMDRLLDTPLELLDRHLEANVMAPLLLTRLMLPAMIERGDGLVANMTSDVAWIDPPAAAGAGGWGLGYAISKGALHRVAGVLARELAGTGVRCVNVSPGFVATERMLIDMAPFGFDAKAGAPPDAIGAALAWLATDPRGREWDGRTFPAQEVCRDLGLLPGWPAR